MMLMKQNVSNNSTKAASSLLMTTRYACLFAVLLGVSLLLGAQTRRGREPVPNQRQPAKAPDAIVPFRAGEHLQYRVLWSKYAVNAATIEFSVMEHKEFFGHQAWHFRALAHTIETTRILYSLDDQFDSYTDATQLTSLQYEAYLREAGKQQNNSWRLITDGSAAPKGVTAARVSPGTRDPIGLLYVLRANDWKGTPELRMPVFDGNHLYDVISRVNSIGQVTVAAGQFTASRIDLRIIEHGKELNDTRFTVWLAQDTARTPVLIEAQVPIGTARVELSTRP
jgi:hypothetical protein